MSLDKSPFSSIADADIGLQICADYAEAKIAVEALKTLEADKSDLHHFFNDFTCDQWDEAGDAMLEAWDFILRGLGSVLGEKDCYLLFVG